MMKNAFVLIFALLSINVFAQNNDEKSYVLDIHGTVKDDFTGADLPASITLMTEDSMVVDTITALHVAKRGRLIGYFFSQEKIRKGTYIFKASLKGYDDVCISQKVRYPSRMGRWNIPLMKMHRRADSYVKDLDVVNVTGTMVRMVHKGDTIIYNAQAFKVPEGSMLDALIKQLPGAELHDNGDIVVNGRKIDNLTLNGDDFFKGNNEVMLENLPYYTVNQIKVYDEHSALSKKLGRDVEEKVYTMDVVLKREYHRGYIANVEGGAGTNHRYTGQVFALGYGDLSRISVYGNLNNLNKNPKPGSQGTWKPEKIKKGRSAVKKAGLDYQTKDKVESYKNHFTSEIQWNSNDVTENTRVQQFVSPYDINTTSLLQNLASSFKWKADNQLDLGKSFTWNLNTQYNKVKATEVKKDSTYTIEDFVNRSRIDDLTERKTFEIGSNIDYSISLPWGDNLYLSANGGYSKEDYTSDKYSRIIYSNALYNEDRRLFGDNPSSRYNFGGSAQYYVRFADYYNVSATLGYAQSNEDNTADYLRNGGVDENSYTSSLMNRSANAKFGISYQNVGQNYKIASVGAILKRSQDHYRLSTPRGSGELSRWYTLPSCNMLLLFGLDNKSLRVKYDYTFTSPDMRMMYGPSNTLDPLVTIYRNAGLKKTGVSTLEVMASRDIDWHRLRFVLMSEWHATHAKVSYQKSVDPLLGKYGFMPDNVNGNWDAYLQLYGTMNIDKKGLFSISERTIYKYIHDVDFDITTNALSEVLSKVNTGRITQNIILTYKKGKTQIDLKGNLIASNVKSNREKFSNFTYYNYDYSLNVQVPLFWKLNFVNDFGVYYRRGYLDKAMNDEDMVWNASLSRSFAKGKLVATVEAYDLLHQLSKNSIVVNAQARTETHVNTLPNYFMLRLQYRFSKKPKK